MAHTMWRLGMAAYGSAIRSMTGVWKDQNPPTTLSVSMSAG